MANELFSIQPEGYSTEEVDRYIDMLQEEYRNAIAWGEEMEAKLQEVENSLKETGMYFFFLLICHYLLGTVII